jgi:outer membrane protein assembly factor BamD
MKIKYLLFVTGIISVFLFLDGCGSSNLTKILSAEERFAMGKAKFDDEDYLEAITEFEIVKMQFQGSAVADDAQYYLAECRFKREEYLLAAMEYQTLKSSMPSSSFAPSAQYKIGLCYYNLAPNSFLDQEYTNRAIDEFQAFIEYYPKDDLAPDATMKIKELTDRLSKKLYDIADLYMILEYYKSATIYYTIVFEKYNDTQYAELALLGRARSLVARNKLTDARRDIDKYFDKYTEGQLVNEATALQNEINAKIAENSSGSGK